MKKIYYLFFILTVMCSSALGGDLRPTIQDAYKDADRRLRAIVETDMLRHFNESYISYDSLPTIVTSSVAEVSPELVGDKFMVKGTTDDGMPFLTVKLEKRNNKSSKYKSLKTKCLVPSTTFCTATLVPQFIQQKQHPGDPFSGYFYFNGQYKVVIDTKCNSEASEAKELLPSELGIDKSVTKLQRFIIGYINLYVRKESYIEGVATSNYFWFPYIPTEKTENTEL
jgi:hypothetical protein